MGVTPVIIEATDLERTLDRVRAEALGPLEGAFGPDSVLWQIDREALVFLGAGRALLMQLGGWAGSRQSSPPRPTPFRARPWRALSVPSATYTAAGLR